MCRTIWFVVFVTILCIGSANGALVRLAGSDGSQPFSVTYNGGYLPLIFEIFNETDAILNAVIWQLDLEILGTPNSVGHLYFEDVKAPPDSLFGPVPGPLSVFVDTNTHIVVFDADVVNSEGQSIPTQASRNIVELSLIAEPGAHGDFELRMRGFDPALPTGGSSLLEAGDPLPEPFNNPISEVAGSVRLGAISVALVPEPATCWSFLIWPAAASNFRRIRSVKHRTCENC
jgi:hypothetical protein